MPIQETSFRSKLIIDKHPSEVLYRSVDFASVLLEGEALTGTPTVTVEDASGLTIDDKVIVGTKVQFSISVGTVRLQPWTITVMVNVSGGSVAQVYVAEVRVRVAQALS